MPYFRTIPVSVFLKHETSLESASAISSALDNHLNSRANSLQSNKFLTRIAVKVINKFEKAYKGPIPIGYYNLIHFRPRFHLSVSTKRLLAVDV